jgi:hypothetical protein
LALVEDDGGHGWKRFPHSRRRTLAGESVKGQPALTSALG